MYPQIELEPKAVPAPDNNPVSLPVSKRAFAALIAPLALSGAASVSDTANAAELNFENTSQLTIAAGSFDDPASFKLVCNATRLAAVHPQSEKVSKNLALTASHCFRHGIGFNGTTPVIPGIVDRPINLFQFATKTTYVVSHPDRPTLPLGRVTGIAMHIDRPGGETNDTSVIQFEPIARTQPSYNSSRTNASLSSIKALSLDRFRAVKPETDKNAKVAISSVSEAGKGRAHGVYLGRTYYMSQEVDVVGLPAKNPKTDRCFFGASGSVATLKNGRLLGPLSTRIGLNDPSYFAQRNMQTPNGGSYAAWRRDIRSERAFMQQIMGVNFRVYPTLCLHSVLSRQKAFELKDALGNYPNEEEFARIADNLN